MIDWERLLARNHIEFVDRGTSTAKGNLYVQCPFCGSSDQGTHMGISLAGRGWGCWRNARHRGKNPVRLLAALLKISFAQAEAMLGSGFHSPASEHSLQRQFEALHNNRVRTIERPSTIPCMPKEFRELRDRGGYNDIFFEWLRTVRGYDRINIASLIDDYDLHFAIQGPFSYRLIIPIYDMNGALATWTGRAITPLKEPRYLSLSHELGWMSEKHGLPLALSPISDYLFNERGLFQFPGSALVVCEGPFDSIRVDRAIRELDGRATCLFGKKVSPTQIDKLAMLSEFYDNKFLLLDPDAELDTLEVIDPLTKFGFRSLKLPSEFEDPGDPKLPLAKIRNLVEREIR